VKRFLVILGLGVTLLTVPATAGTTAPTRTIASYCSPSGDVCYGIFVRDGKVILQITTAARYFSRYTLCVTRLPRSSNAEHAQRCGAFPLFRGGGGTWHSSVSYVRQFPVVPSGRHEVRWRQVCSRCTPQSRRHSAAGQPLGPSLFFRWPVRRS